MPTPPADDDELLYRQIGPRGNPIYFDPNKPCPVHQSVFLPSRKDTDGLSLLRRRFRTEIWSAYRLEQPSVRFRLARLQCGRLRQVATERGIPTLNHIPAPDALDIDHGEPWAHCLVSEVNRTAYDADQEARKRIKEWALGISDSISNDDVIGPFEEPTEGDAYRP